jgi:hypothetical protein
MIRLVHQVGGEFLELVIELDDWAGTFAAARQHEIFI